MRRNVLGNLYFGSGSWVTKTLVITYTYPSRSKRDKGIHKRMQSPI